MVGFKTKNSVYMVNNKNKEITGGYFGDKWVKYKHLQAIVNNKAKIQLADGRIVTTGIVKEYI